MLCDWWLFDVRSEIFTTLLLGHLSMLFRLKFSEDIILMSRCETGTVVHTAFMFCFLFLCPLFSVFSFFLWNSLWLVEEMLTSLCLFLIVRMEISQFL